MKHLARFLMKLGGWTFRGDTPVHKKAIIISAPHTSFWDWYWGELSFLATGVPAYIPIKKELFFFPLGWFLRALHALPVNRGKKGNNMVNTLEKELAGHDRAYICITPEGSRKPRKKWKKGFLMLAYETGLPVYLGGLNYEEKYTWMGEPFPLTGDIDTDLKAVQHFYKDAKAKYPAQFSTGE